MQEQLNSNSNYRQSQYTCSTHNQCWPNFAILHANCLLPGLWEFQWQTTRMKTAAWWSQLASSRFPWRPAWLSSPKSAANSSKNISLKHTAGIFRQGLYQWRMFPAPPVWSGTTWGGSWRASQPWPALVKEDGSTSRSLLDSWSYLSTKPSRSCLHCLTEWETCIWIAPLNAEVLWDRVHITSLHVMCTNDSKIGVIMV